jgi:hypothetical protein
MLENGSFEETRGHLCCPLEFEALLDNLLFGILLDVEQIMLYLNRVLVP